MKQSKIEKIKSQIHQIQDGARFEHTIGVMYTAAALAMRYDMDLEQSMTAGLLHDCAKSFSSEEKLSLCKSYGLSITDAEAKNPGLLHAKLGAYIARHTYGITDQQILDAIEYHTTGRPKMTMLDKIIYIADYIEPNRNQAPNLEAIRKQAFIDIDACLYTILEASLQYLQTRSEVIDPMTEQTYLYYKKLRNV